MQESKLRELLLVKIARVIFPEGQLVQKMYKKHYDTIDLAKIDYRIKLDLKDYNEKSISEQFEIVSKLFTDCLLEKISSSQKSPSSDELGGFVEDILVYLYEEELKYVWINFSDYSLLDEEVGAARDKQLQNLIDEKISDSIREANRKLFDNNIISRFNNYKLNNNNKNKKPE
jgi:hypothetical protein